jgi:hypothetical protein
MRIIMRFPYVGDNSSGHVYVYILRPWACTFRVYLCD